MTKPYQLENSTHNPVIDTTHCIEGLLDFFLKHEES